MLKEKNICAIAFLYFIFITNLHAQLDYNLMTNWAFHPSKAGTLIDGYNLDIAVINKSLETDTVFEIKNNAMQNTGVDVFFIHPTILADLYGYSTRENIPLSEQSSFLISASILGQAGLLAQYGRFFCTTIQAIKPSHIHWQPIRQYSSRGNWRIL